MAVPKITDPVLIERLRQSAAGFDWAAKLVQPYQHVAGHDDWTAHRDAWHLVDVERHYLRPRLEALLRTEAPDLRELARSERPDYSPDRDIVDLAREFMDERRRTVALFDGLSAEQWARTGTWSEGRVVDVAWVGERVLWHGLDHFAVLLRMHNQFESQQAPRWEPAG